MSLEVVAERMTSAHTECFLCSCCCGGVWKGSGYHPSRRMGFRSLYSWAIDHTLRLSLDVEVSRQWTCILGASWKIPCDDVGSSMVVSCNRLDWVETLFHSLHSANRHPGRWDTVGSVAFPTPDSYVGILDILQNGNLCRRIQRHDLANLVTEPINIPFSAHSLP